jgi:hypothetical protein
MPIHLLKKLHSRRSFSSLVVVPNLIFVLVEFISGFQVNLCLFFCGLISFNLISRSLNHSYWVGLGLLIIHYIRFVRTIITVSCLH